MQGDLSWYAVMTQPRAEVQAAWHLERKGYATFYPHYWEIVSRGRYRAREEKRPYLSRYIFVGLGADHHAKKELGPNVYPIRPVPILHPINETTGVSTVVYAPGGIPFPIHPWVMHELMGRTEKNGRVKGTKGKQRLGWKAGDKLKLGEKSPYWNFICEIQSIDSSNRIVVLLESFGRQVTTLVKPEDVQEIITQSGDVIRKSDPRLVCKSA